MKLASRKTDPSTCDPHGADGPSNDGSPDVLINSLPALRVADTGQYPSSCDSLATQAKHLLFGAGSGWHAAEGCQTVLVNNRELVAEGHATLHPHGPGKMKSFGTNVFVGGSALNILEQSRQDAIELIDNAINSIDRWNADDQKRFEEWFGETSEEARKAMRDKLLAIRDRLHSMQIVAGDGKEFAYVYPSDSSKVYVCDAYWKANRTGTDSRAGTMVHEGSHYWDTAGAKDHAYGHPAAKALAKSDPKKAQNNADSIEYFTETAPK